MRYVVYTEIIDNDIQRWFYGVYENSDRANQVALELGSNYPIFHCVCREDEAEDFNIMNLPRR